MQEIAELKITEYQDYFASFIDDSIAAERLISSIHHDVHGKTVNIIRVAIESANEDALKANIDLHKEEHSYVTSFASKDVSEIIKWQDNARIKAMMKPSIYFSINSFHGLRRYASRCHTVNCIYLDIDGHKLSGKHREEAIKKAQRILNKAWNEGRLLKPSQITHSGRGLGLYYILDRSIANILATKELLRYFDFVYEMLIKSYTELLRDTGLDVDTCVTDRSRIARMPGSYNYKADTKCRLYNTVPVYYCLKGIFDGCNLQAYVVPRDEYQRQRYGRTYDVSQKAFNTPNKDKKRELKKDTKLIDLGQYRATKINITRIAFFEKYIIYMQEKNIVDGHRERTLFLLYNALVQVMDRQAAKEKLFKVNTRLQDPYPLDKIINGIFSSVDKVVNKHGKQGYYVITNHHIMNLLDLSYVQASELGLFGTTNLRDALKEATADNKSKIKEIIKETVTSCPELNRNEIHAIVNAQIEQQGLVKRNKKQVHISLRTLDRMIKELELNKVGTLAYTCTAEYKARETRIQANLDKKVVKFAKSSADKILPKIAPECSSVPTVETVVDSLGFDSKALQLLSDIRNAYVCSISPKAAKLFNAFASYYKNLSGTVAFHSNKEKALNFLCSFYLNNLDDGWLNCFLNDLDFFTKAISVGQVSISVHYQKVPSVVWKDGLDWQPVDYSIPQHLSKKNTSDNSPSKITYEQLPYVILADYMCRFDDWIYKNGYEPIYHKIETFADDDPDIRTLLGTLCYARKDNRLKGLFKELEELDKRLELTATSFKESIEKTYKQSISNIKFTRASSHQSECVKTLYKNCRQVWEWIFDYNRDCRNVAIKSAFKDLNRKFKESPDSLVCVNGFMYRAIDFKKTILYRLTIEDLKSTDETMHDNEMLEFWYNLIIERYTNLEIPVVYSFSTIQAVC